MTNVPGARERGPDELKDVAADAGPLFPSEGTFSAVVPLSQVRGGRAASRDSAATAIAVAHEEPEEATLVPSRVSPSARARRETRRGGQHWLSMTAAVALSVFAGLAVGAYVVWSRQARQAQPPVTSVAETVSPTQAATEAPQPEPSPSATTPAPEVAAAAHDAVVKVEKAEASEPARKAEPPTASAARAPAVEPASRRAAARERAKAEASEASPAPKPARRETAVRRQATPTRTRPPATAANGRALPVSSPPPSSKSRTVIQWP